MKNAITILCIVAVTFVAQPVSAGHHSLAHAWEFQPQQCSPRPQDLRRQLLCSDPELRQADIALSKAYQEKIAQLAPAEVDALRSDSRAWWGTYSCVGDDRDGHPLSREVVRTCLKQVLAKRRQFVLALPTDRPKSTYLFSQTELGLLRTYHVGQIGGLINRYEQDALTLGLRRVLGAMLPHRPVPLYSISDSLTRFTADAFLFAAADDATALEDDRYLVDYSSDWRKLGVAGIFVVDLETGESILAFVDEEEPVLLIWQKACVSPTLQDESYALFQNTYRKCRTLVGRVARLTANSIAEFIPRPAIEVWVVLVLAMSRRPNDNAANKNPANISVCGIFRMCWRGFRYQTTGIRDQKNF